MAKLVEKVMVVKVSKLCKDSEVVSEIFNEESMAQLEAVIEELVGDEKAIVEVIDADE